MLNQSNKTVLTAMAAIAIQISSSTTAFSAEDGVSNADGDWCTWLQSKPGTIYKNEENPYLQYLQVGGRLQYQTAHIDGEDVNGKEFNDNYDDFRRVRLETDIEFLRYFSAEIKINMVNDARPSGRDLDWGYETFDEAIFSFDIGKAFSAGPFDSVKLNYGRFKVNMTEEVHMSSKKILTIERSSLANKLYGVENRASGFTLEVEKNKWLATLGVFSSEDDSEFIGGFHDAMVYYLSMRHQTTEEWAFMFDSIIQDRTANDNNLGYNWAGTLNAIYQKDRMGLISTLAVGENSPSVANRGGSFYGFVVMPWYWLIDKKLQAVVQYQYMGASESEGIRTNSRYIRAQHSAGVNVNSGRGDELHTLYTGLNYHFCGDNLKIMAGIEYGNLSTPAGDVDTFTYLLGFRTYF